MSEIMGRIKAGEYAAYKRHPYAKYWLAAGLIIAVYTAISAPFNTNAKPGDFASILPFYVPTLVGCFLSPFARDAFFWDDAGAKYDEFEANALNTARARAYIYLWIIASLMFLWLWAGTSLELVIPSRPYDWSAVSMAFLVIGGSMPAFIAEQLIPIPPIEPMETDEVS